MADDGWQQARLIPTSGINGQEEAERRATSALLAVMGAVREFGTAITKPLGAPAGLIGTFIEVPFKVGERTCYPDGLLEVSRGGRTWTALVEVKTGAAELQRDQIETYLDVARDSGFDLVLTVSNEMAPAPGVHPIDVDKRKLRKVALHHLSWAEVLTIAVQQRVHRGVSDPEQAWILGELIRYLEHPRSGALDFSEMGSAWVTVREAVAAGTLRANDKGLAEVVSRWEQLLRFAALRLGRELGADVQVQLSRKEVADPTLRFAAQAQSLVTAGVLTGTLRIPDAISPLDITADLRTGRVTVSVDVDAPKEGRAATRVNWLVRQLKDAPDNLRIDAFAVQQRTSTSELLRAVRDNPAALIADPKRDLRTFRVAAVSPLGTKRGTGRGGFIDSVLASVDGFYEVVIQQLRPWVARAPQLPGSGRTAAEEAGIDIEPPPQDLLEPTEDELVGDAPPETEPPEIVVEAVEAAEAGADAAEADEALEPDARNGAGAAADVAPVEMVSWDSAQVRLDHERSVTVDAAD
ncbi:MAG: stress response protein [Acidimicrobiia bacterium]